MCVSLNNQISIPLLVYILMNTVNSFTTIYTIHLQLNEINVLEFAILLITYLIK